MRSIEIQDVGVDFRKRDGTVSTILDGCELTIEHGTFVSVLGRSGGGKTTLLRVVAGLLRPSRGQVSIGGRPVEESSRELSMVFQRPVLLPWRTVLDNVLLPLEFRDRRTKESEEEARALLTLTGLEETAKMFPYELSGGMQQRVAICRALASDPSVMLMDEPFGALDAMTRDVMNMELRRIWLESKRSILFVTHSVSEAVFLSDRVIVIGGRPGHVVLDLPISLPKARTRDIRYTNEFRELEEQLSAILGQGSVTA